MRLPSTYSLNPQDIWNAIRAGNQTHMRMTFNAQDIVLTEADIDMSAGIDIDDAFNSDDIIKIGKVVCKKLTTRVILSDRLDNFKWVDRFKLEFGVEINGSTQWTVFGYFNGQIPKKIDNNTMVEYTAYDDAYKFDVPRTERFISLLQEHSGMIFLSELLDLICGYVGVKKNFSSYNIGGGCKKSDIKDFSTLKEIMEKIAEGLGVNFFCNEKGECDFTWFGKRNRNFYLLIDQTDEFALQYDEVYNQKGYKWSEFETRTWNKYSETTWQFVTGFITDKTINEVGVYIDNELEDWYGTGLANRPIYNITDNVFTGGDSPISYYGDSTAELVFNNLNPLGSITPLSVECTGNWMLEAGDYVDVKISADKTIRTPIFYRSFHWGGNCTDTIETGSTI